MQQLTRNIFVETGFQGSNVSFVVTKAGSVMIDTSGIPGQASQWREVIEKHAPIRYLINTEPHVDHFSGVFFFPETFVAHQGTRRALSRPDALKQIRSWLESVEPCCLDQTTNFAVKLPEITFSENLTLYLGDHTFELYNLSGHTASQIAIYIPEERVLFTGDNIVYRRQPYLMDCQPFQWLESLKRIGDFKADHVVPGHGDVCQDQGFVREFSLFIQEWIGAVQKAIQQGLSKDEAMNSISFLDRSTGLLVFLP